MKGMFNRYLIMKVVLDFPMLFLSYWLALAINSITFHFVLNLNIHLSFLITSIVCWYLSARISKLNTDRRFNNFAEEIVYILYTVLIFSVMEASNLFFFKLYFYFNNSFFLTYILVLLFCILVVKYSVRKYLHLFTNKGKLYERILVIGDHLYANHFHEVISQHSFYGFQCVGALYENNEGFENCPYLGSPSMLNKIIEDTLIDEVVIALPKNKEKEINEIIILCNNTGIKVRIIPDFMHFTASPMTIENIGLIPVISQQSYPLEEWFNQLLKRSFDIAFSLLFLITIGIWLFPLIAILIKLNSRGPVFYRQTRWGLNNKHFKVYKFRTMYNQVDTIDDNGKFMQTHKGDTRITFIGRLLRPLSLDELPQFINTLLGEMSIVGPRPHAIPQNIESLDAVSSYTIRHIIKPGITGWAQVNGCRGITKSHFDMQNRVNYDLYYIRKWNFWLDIQIILQTIFQLIKGNENVY